jgi:hypothetical protein
MDGFAQKDILSLRNRRKHKAFYEAGSCQGEFGLIGSPFYSSFHGVS